MSMERSEVVATQAALQETTVVGVDHNISYLRIVTVHADSFSLSDPDFNQTNYAQHSAGLIACWGG